MSTPWPKGIAVPLFAPEGKPAAGGVAGTCRPLLSAAIGPQKPLAVRKNQNSFFFPERSVV
jgi:hypothetical protein